MIIVINKEKKKHEVIGGRDYGKFMRKLHKLDYHDRANDSKIIIMFSAPVSLEFLVGFFGGSFKVHKDFEVFCEHYSVGSVKGVKALSKDMLRNAFDIVIRGGR